MRCGSVASLGDREVAGTGRAYLQDRPGQLGLIGGSDVATVLMMPGTVVLCPAPFAYVL
jgi:hypothetical protein